jgi:hypothetical protein
VRLEPPSLSAADTVAEAVADFTAEVVEAFTVEAATSVVRRAAEGFAAAGRLA